MFTFHWENKFLIGQTRKLWPIKLSFSQFWTGFEDTLAKWATKDSINEQIFRIRNYIFLNIFQVQQCIEFLVDEALRMGAHPDDRDSVTDMTFLMFTCKAGAAGVGDGTMAAKVLRFGIEMGS